MRGLITSTCWYWRGWKKRLKCAESSIAIGTIVMKPVELYTSPLCGFCHAAKRLLKEKGVSFQEVNVLAQPGRKPEMIKRANGGRTVPQIFIGETHVGGCDELYALERAGKLDALLAA